MRNNEGYRPAARFKRRNRGYRLESKTGGYFRPNPNRQARPPEFVQVGDMLQQISANKLNIDPLGDQFRISGFVEQNLNGFATNWTVIDSPFVDVHAYEAVGQGWVEVAGVGQGVIEGFLAILQSINDRLFEQSGDFLDLFLTEILANHVAAEGQWQAVAVILLF